MMLPLCLPILLLVQTGHCFSPRPLQSLGNILILDHINMNHEKGRHDWLKSFYFDFLQCAVDPRKEDNLAKGQKTLWANIGANQFHLPEGKPDAQVLNGIVTLAFPNLQQVLGRCEAASAAMNGSQFACERDGDALLVTDPWGSKFRLVEGSDDDRDDRGTQPGQVSEGLGLVDLTLFTPMGSNMAGIGRFYERVLQAPVFESDSGRCIVSVGPRQTLTFVTHPKGLADVTHEDLRDDEVAPPEGFPSFLSNYGIHVSMYVADLPETYDLLDKLEVTYVNPRFKRRAYTKDEAIDDCMVRCLDIVDPDHPEDGPIVKLEHEIRSVVKRDGGLYKSCPFDEVPKQCAVVN